MACLLPTQQLNARVPNTTGCLLRHLRAGARGSGKGAAIVFGGESRLNALCLSKGLLTGFRIGRGIDALGGRSDSPTAPPSKAYTTSEVTARSTAAKARRSRGENLPRGRRVRTWPGHCPQHRGLGRAHLVARERRTCGEAYQRQRAVDPVQSTASGSPIKSKRELVTIGQ